MVLNELNKPLRVAVGLELKIKTLSGLNNSDSFFVRFVL